MPQIDAPPLCRDNQIPEYSLFCEFFPLFRRFNSLFASLGNSAGSLVKYQGLRLAETGCERPEIAFLPVFFPLIREALCEASSPLYTPPRQKKSPPRKRNGREASREGSRHGRRRYRLVRTVVSL